MFHIALHQPEIPPNTGNIIRLCANTGCSLQLVGKTGFSMDEKSLRRAGLDYGQYCKPRIWADWESFVMGLPGRLVTFSTKHSSVYSDFTYAAGDILVFGSESAGLPENIRNHAEPDCRLTIPMQHHSRSINLSNSVAIVVYEAWRQAGFRS